jgi:hypothetical protein
MSRFDLCAKREILTISAVEVPWLEKGCIFQATTAVNKVTAVRTQYWQAVTGQSTCRLSEHREDIGKFIAVCSPAMQNVTGGLGRRPIL